jgi:hypothetical protein
VLNKLYPEQYLHGKLPPDHLAAISLATGALWSVVGGYITAWLAPRKRWHHIAALVIWGEVMGIASAVMTWGQIQHWYQIGLILAWVPAVAIGGWLRAGKPDFQGA